MSLSDRSKHALTPDALLRPPPDPTPDPCPHPPVLQDAIDECQAPEEMRHRIMTFYRHKYKGGQYWHQESVLKELPYDMQVSFAPALACICALTFTSPDAACEGKVR